MEQLYGFLYVSLVIGAWKLIPKVPTLVSWLFTAAIGVTDNVPPAPVEEDLSAGPAWEPPQYRPPPPRPRPALATAVCGYVEPITERLPTTRESRSPAPPPLFARVRDDWHLLRPDFRTGTTTAIERLRS